ncbi:MAG: thiamine ABC transporter substrate-binding protein [Gaiellaceae bacterium]|nr:MAG: thiamine ABC transporter substrate-binding protein [Gaiellaceae bacterium]
MRDRDVLENPGSRGFRPGRRTLALVLVLTLALALGTAGCGSAEETPTEVVLVTHDSFAISDEVKRAFERESGFRLRILRGGDAGEMVTRALLTAGNPEGDVLFGIDNNLLARALAEDLFVPYESSGLEHVDEEWVLDPEHRVTPIDYGDVCLNVDLEWFAERGLAPPRSMDDLTEPRYRNLTVVENPATSTPGLAFLLATVARYGEGVWQGYWLRLRENGVLVVDGWEEAYTVRFSGASGSRGNRPIVVSYRSSPPAEIIFREPRPTRPPTGVIEDGCYRQIELAGILRGARNEEGARALIDFMLSERFQEDIPLNMFVFPVNRNAEVPPEFAPYAGGSALSLDPEVVEANRETWVREWTRIVLR